MGCDIHLFVEHRDKYKNWRDVYKPLKSKYGWHENYYATINRHYDLFAILADVRNSSNVKPISKPRGLPEDVSLGVKANADNDGSDGHSHSWLTLEELLSVDWKNKLRFPDDIMETISRLTELDSDPQSVRIVFWFDN